MALPEQNPTPRSKFLASQRNQTVTGGLNRPATPNDSYTKVVDTSGKTITPPPSEKPKDASFTQGNSVYDPATRTLLPIEQQKTSAMARATVSNSPDKGSPTNINGNQQIPYIPNLIDRALIGIGNFYYKNVAPNYTVDYSTVVRGTSNPVIFFPFEALKFTYSKQGGEFFKDVKVPAILGYQLPTAGQLAFTGFFSPFMATTGSQIPKGTPAKVMEVNPQTYNPQFETKTYDIGIIKQAGDKDYQVLTKYVSKSGDYTYRGISAQYVSPTEVQTNFGEKIVAGSGKGSYGILNNNNEIISGNTFTNKYLKIGSMGDKSVFVNKINYAGSEIPQVSYSITSPTQQDYIFSQSTTSPPVKIQPANLEISGTTIRNAPPKLVFPNYPSSSGLYKFVPDVESIGTKIYAIGGGNSLTNSVSSLSKDISIPDISSSLSSSASNLFNQGLKGITSNPSLLIGSIPKTSISNSLTSQTPSTKTNSRVIPASINKQVNWVDYGTNQIYIPKLDTSPKLATPPRQPSSTGTGQVQTPVPIYNYPTPSPSPTPTIVPPTVIPKPVFPNPPRIFPMDFPSFDFSGSLSTKTYKGKQRYKYTPSYEALVFNIKKGSKSRFKTSRPITKGFSWSYNQIKLPKLRF